MGAPRLPVFKGEEAAISPSGRTLLFFGPYPGDYKGLDVLLEALPQDPDVLLALAGDPLDPVPARSTWTGVSSPRGSGLPVRRPRCSCQQRTSCAAAVVLPYRRLDSSGVLATAIRKKPARAGGGAGGRPLAGRDRARVRRRRGRPALGDPQALAQAAARLLEPKAPAAAHAGACRVSAALTLGLERRGAPPPLPRGAPVSRFPKRLDRFVSPPCVSLVLLSPLLAAIAAWILVDGLAVCAARPGSGSSGKGLPSLPDASVFGTTWASNALRPGAATSRTASAGDGVVPGSTCASRSLGRCSRAALKPRRPPRSSAERARGAAYPASSARAPTLLRAGGELQRPLTATAWPSSPGIKRPGLQKTGQKRECRSPVRSGIQVTPFWYIRALVTPALSAPCKDHRAHVAPSFRLGEPASSWSSYGDEQIRVCGTSARRRPSRS